MRDLMASYAGCPSEYRSPTTACSRRKVPLTRSGYESWRVSKISARNSNRRGTENAQED